MEYLVVKWLHILSSTLLFGTGIGSAWYLLLASLAKDARAAAVTARHVVWADTLFTATTAVFQPLSGVYLLHLAGIPLSTKWVAQSLMLYAVAIGCWLPVVWLQIRMRNLAEQAVGNGEALPRSYRRCLAAWAVLGVPAFFAFLAIFWLMVFKPV